MTKEKNIYKYNQITTSIVYRQLLRTESSVYTLLLLYLMVMPFITSE